jgi:hypothetical protein
MRVGKVVRSSIGAMQCATPPRRCGTSSRAMLGAR